MSGINGYTTRGNRMIWQIVMSVQRLGLRYFMSQIQNSAGSNVMTPMCMTPGKTVAPLLPVFDVMPSACCIWDHLITPNSLITL